MCKSITKTYRKIKHKISQRNCVVYKHGKLAKLILLMTIRIEILQATLTKLFKDMLFEKICLNLLFNMDLGMTLDFKVTSKPKSKNNNDQKTDHHKFVFSVEFPF